MLGIGMEDGGVLLTLQLPSSPPPIASSEPTAMEVDDTPTSDKMTPDQATQLILSSNFDTDSKECILTLCKMMDNVIAKPGNEKVRCIRLSNENFDGKVGSRRGGGIFGSVHELNHNT
eukprot:2626763-Ditylum_brightwellii.AAC.1